MQIKHIVLIFLLIISASCYKSHQPLPVDGGQDIEQYDSGGQCPGGILDIINRSTTISSTLQGENDINGCSQIGVGQEDIYEIQIDELSNFEAEITYANFDTVVYLMNECEDTSTEIICDDNGGGNFYSKVNINNIQPGIYYLVVDGKEISNTDTYNLEINITPVTEECPGGIVREITETTTVNGTTSGTDHINGCQGEAGSADDIYVIEITSLSSLTAEITYADYNYDPMMYLMNDCNNLTSIIQCDDDSAGELKPRLYFDTIESGIYYLVVDGFGTSSSGYYTLEIDISPVVNPDCEIEDTIYYSGSYNLELCDAENEVIPCSMNGDGVEQNWKIQPQNYAFITTRYPYESDENLYLGFRQDCDQQLDTCVTAPGGMGFIYENISGLDNILTTGTVNGSYCRDNILNFTVDIYECSNNVFYDTSYGLFMNPILSSPAIYNISTDYISIYNIYSAVVISVDLNEESALFTGKFAQLSDNGLYVYLSFIKYDSHTHEPGNYLAVFDLSSNTFINTVALGPDIGGDDNILDMEVSGDYLYVLTQNEGKLVIFDISNPSLPVYSSEHYITDSSEPEYLDDGGIINLGNDIWLVSTNNTFWLIWGILVERIWDSEYTIKDMGYIYLNPNSDELVFFYIDDFNLNILELSNINDPYDIEIAYSQSIRVAEDGIILNNLSFIDIDRLSITGQDTINNVGIGYYIDIYDYENPVVFQPFQIPVAPLNAGMYYYDDSYRYAISDGDKGIVFIDYSLCMDYWD